MSTQLEIPKTRPPGGNISSVLAPQQRQESVNTVQQEKEKKPTTTGGKKVPPKEEPEPPDRRGIAYERRKRLKLAYGIISVPVLPRLPHDRHIASYMHALQQFMDQTGVERIFLGLMQSLLSLPELPYNPYPDLVYNLRQYMEGQQISSETVDQIMFSFNHPVMKTRIDYLYKARDVEYLWGLSSPLRCCNAERLNQYQWLMKDLIPNQDALTQPNQNYTIQPMVTLVGPAAFHGSFYTHVSTIEVKCELLVVGPDIEQATEIYLNTIIKDLNYIEKTTHHIILGVSIPVNPKERPLKSVYRFWQVNEINILADDFWEAAVHATTNKKPIIAELIFKTDYFMTVHRRGRKIYNLNVILPAETHATRERLYCFAELPESAMFEGVFFERTHVEAYLGMFTPRLELMDMDKLHKIEPPPPPVPHTIYHRFTLPNAPQVVVRRPKLEKKPDPPEVMIPKKEGDVEVENLPLNNKIKIDGFLQKMSEEYSPDAWQITKPIKSHWQRRIARSFEIADIFEILPIMIQLILMDRQAHPPQLMVQFYKLLRSKGYVLYVLIQQNRFIRELIENFEKAEESQIVQLQFKEYVKNIVQLLNSEIRQCSSEMVTAGRHATYRLTGMSLTEVGPGSNITLSPKSVLDMRFLNFYLLPVLWQMQEDTLAECPDVFDFCAILRRAFPEEVQDIPVLMERPNYFYGYEDERILNQDRQVLNVQSCVKKETSIPQIAMESVLMKYMLDTRIDDVWFQYMMELFSRTNLPQDPYPQLVTGLRQAALKMNLFFESDEAVVKRLYHANPRHVDPLNHVFNIPGCDSYGYMSALNVLDTAAFFRLTPILLQLQNSTFQQLQKGYHVAIAMGVIGDVPLFGRMDPYLRSVEIAEHVYVKGPISCAKEGSEVFASVVSQHVLELHSRPDFNYVVIGVFLGAAEDRWGIEQIRTKTRSFEVEVEKAVEENKNIYLKMLAVMEWRYVTVVKHFRYHFLSYNEQEYMPFFTEDPAEVYLTVFLEQERAAFHYQRGGSHQCCDPFTAARVRSAFDALDRKMVEASEKQDWLGVHRALLSKTLIRRGKGHLAEAWRMLHSPAAALNFVNHLNKSLQDIVFYVLEYRDFVSVPVEDDHDYTYGNLDDNILCSTLAGYYHRLNDLLSDSATLAPNCMAKVVRRQLNDICYVREDGIVSLRFDSSSIRVLEEIRQETLCLEHALGYDVHSSCPEAQQALKSGRASYMIRRPFEYEPERPRTREDVVRRGQLVVADITNEWHHWVG